MASLASTNWTIAYPTERRIDTVYADKKKRIDLKLTMASGEWPAAGVAMPSAGSVGLVRNRDYFLMAPKMATASGRRVLFNLTTAHNMRALQDNLMSGTGRALSGLATTITVKSQIFFVTVVGW